MTNKPKPHGALKFTQDLADEICQRLSEGQSLRSICQDEHMPSQATVLNWSRRMPEFGENYARAREAGWSVYSDQIIDITDNVDTSDNVAVQKARLQVDSRKWMLSKMLPKVYGDKITHAGDEENPLIPEESVTNRELAKAAALLIKKGLDDKG